MTPDKKRAILEAAARACGVEFKLAENNHVTGFTRSGVSQWIEWNPIDNSADTASMCARLNIDLIHYCGSLECRIAGIKQGSLHDGTPDGKEAAWRLAASMVAAKVGGYTDA